jgi:hypothetical protein
MLHAAQSLDDAVTAMVIGQQQTFSGNYFPGTTAPKITIASFRLEWLMS